MLQMMVDLLGLFTGATLATGEPNIVIGGLVVTLRQAHPE